MGRSVTKSYCHEGHPWYRENADRIKEVGCKQVSDEAFGEFEDELVRQFVLEPECSGVRIVRYDDITDSSTKVVRDAEEKPHWDLKIDFNPARPDFKASRGWMIDQWSGVNRIGGKVDGRGDGKTTVETVCAIVKGRGATIVN